MSHVLIIEDDALLSHMYLKVFEAAGYKVTTADNGQDGLDAARASRPDVVLLDIMMPKLNGIETLKQFKADDKLKGVPIVVLTNLAGHNDVELALKLGAVKYLVKSENRPAQVEEVVQGVLASSPSEA